MIVGSRGSTLALWQAHRVCEGLGLDRKAVRIIQTAGDKGIHRLRSILLERSESSPKLLMMPCSMEKSILRCIL